MTLFKLFAAVVCALVLCSAGAGAEEVRASAAKAAESKRKTETSTHIRLELQPLRRAVRAPKADRGAQKRDAQLNYPQLG
jgi:hypothetical protein